MEWRILGALEIHGQRGQVPPRPRKQQVLLGILLLNANRPVPVSVLFDGLWNGQPPNSARANLHSYITQLRRLLSDMSASARLTTAADGYQLCVEPGQLDATVFEELAATGRAALGAGDHAAAGERLTEAVGLWRGEVLAGIDLPPSMRPAVVRLQELRLAAIEARIDARAAAGLGAELVPELLAHTEAHPLREHLRGQLMLALHRSGRTPEALDVFRSFRRRLVDELGVEPGEALQRLHRKILTVRPEPTDAGRLAPHQLPADVNGFVGRTRQLGRMDTLLDGGTVLVISGMPGSGKTALAVHWAHRAASRFPDGQLYVNLRGYASGPMLDPLAALTLILRALGVPAARVPVDLDEAVGLYRTLVADRRLTLLLDNAREPEQVRPLLPGGTGCVTLVTSRDRLTGLVACDSARRLALDLLSPDESVELLRHVVDVDGDLAGLADACGHLPLALRIAAAKFAEQPDADLAQYVDALGLGQLGVDGDAQASVRAAFALSYRLLQPVERRLFRLLGLVPGEHVTAGAAAALLGHEASPSLEALVNAHLVEQHAGGRYALHDLLRQFAHDEARNSDTPASCAAAIERLCGFYLDTVDAAARQLYSQTVRIPYGSSPPAASFKDAAAARQWLDAELTNLVALIRHASRHGPRRAAWLLADGLRGYFWIRRPIAEWLAVGADGLAAAAGDPPTAAGARVADPHAVADDRVADPHAVAAMRLSLGLARRSIGQLAVADEHLAAALAASRKAGWLEAQASTLGHIAVSHAERGDNHRAIDLLGDALALNRQMGRLAGEAVVLTNMGALRFHLGELRQSIVDADAALRLYKETGNIGGEALALCNLGINHAYLGARRQAWTYLTDGQRLCEQTGDRVAMALGGFGFARLHSDADDYAEAEPHAAAALDLARSAGDAALAALCTVDLAMIRQALHGGGQAVALCAGARAAARAASNMYAEVWELINLARAYSFQQSCTEALSQAREAVGLARQWRYRLMEGEALRTLAEVLLRTGDRAGGVEAASAAVTCLAECGYRLAEQRARSLLRA